MHNEGRNVLTVQQLLRRYRYILEIVNTFTRCKHNTGYSKNPVGAADVQMMSPFVREKFD